jgi:hypothetical protein
MQHSRPVMVKCKTAPACSGSMGAWDGGEFFPAPHLRAGRDIRVVASGAVILTCPFCKTDHRLELRGVRLSLSKVEEPVGAAV